MAPVLFATSCIEEIDPQSSTVSKDQVANAPGSTDKLTAAITSQMTGSPLYGSTPSDYAWDFGYTTTFIWRNVMGQDMVNLDDKTNWYSVSDRPTPSARLPGPITTVSSRTVTM